MCGILVTGDIFSFSGGFFLALHILSPWHSRWQISPLSHLAIISFPLLLQPRGVVLFAVPTLCGPPPSLPHSLQGILLVNRRKLTLTRHSIILHLLVALSCNYIRPVLVMVLEGGSHHLKILPE